MNSAGGVARNPIRRHLLSLKHYPSTPSTPCFTHNQSTASSLVLPLGGLHPAWNTLAQGIVGSRAFSFRFFRIACCCMFSRHGRNLDLNRGTPPVLTFQDSRCCICKVRDVASCPRVRLLTVKGLLKSDFWEQSFANRFLIRLDCSPDPSLLILRRDVMRPFIRIFGTDVFFREGVRA